MAWTPGSKSLLKMGENSIIVLGKHGVKLAVGYVATKTWIAWAKEDIAKLHTSDSCTIGPDVRWRLLLCGLLFRELHTERYREGVHHHCLGTREVGNVWKEFGHCRQMLLLPQGPRVDTQAAYWKLRAGWLNCHQDQGHQIKGARTRWVAWTGHLMNHLSCVYQRTDSSSISDTCKRVRS